MKARTNDFLKCVEKTLEQYEEYFLSFRFLAFYTILIDDDEVIPEWMKYRHAEAIKYKIKDPVEYGGQIGGFNNISTYSDAKSRFETAYNRAKKAIEFEKNGKIENAIIDWKKIFGEYFPSYG